MDYLRGFLCGRYALPCAAFESDAYRRGYLAGVFACMDAEPRTWQPQCKQRTAQIVAGNSGKGA